MIWEVLVVIALLFPWWFTEATVIGTCCCAQPLPDCCKPCKTYAESDQRWPCHWSLARSNDFTDGTDQCSLLNGITRLVSVAGLGGRCEWYGEDRYPSPQGRANLFYLAGFYRLEYHLTGGAGPQCAVYELAEGSWTFCGANVMSQVAGPFLCDCSAIPTTVTVTPLAVGSDPTCGCKGVTQCPLLALPNDLHATVSDIGAGNSCFATPQSVAILWDGTIWDSGTVTMTGCGGTHTVRVTCDTAGAIRLWCDGVEFSLGSTTTTSCDSVTFEIRRESVVAQPGACCSSGNCSLRVAATL